MDPITSPLTHYTPSTGPAVAVAPGKASAAQVGTRQDLTALVRGQSAPTARKNSPLYQLIPTFRQDQGGCQAHLETLLGRLGLLAPGKHLGTSGFRWVASRGEGPGGAVKPGSRDLIRRTGDTWTLTMHGNNGQAKVREVELKPGMLLHLAEGVDGSGKWSKQHWVMWLGGERGLVLDSIPRTDPKHPGKNLPGTGKFWEWSNARNWNWNGGDLLRVRSVMDPLAGKD